MTYCANCGERHSLTRCPECGCPYSADTPPVQGDLCGECGLAGACAAECERESVISPERHEKAF